MLYPNQAIISNTIEHGCGQLEVLVNDKASIHIFDSGYLDYEQLDRMTNEGDFFVLRLRKNKVNCMLEIFPLTTESNVLSDKMVVNETAQNCSKKYFLN